MLRIVALVMRPLLCVLGVWLLGWGFVGYGMVAAHGDYDRQFVLVVLRMVGPVWLLAAICVAWPVTSFIVAWRRRKGRGFAVEAAQSDP